MKNIVILKLGTSNFRGQTWEDSYKENEVRISGRNKSGKSTRYAAWCWLMSSYTDPSNPANSKLFDDRVELSKDTPVASVWAVISIDGEEYRLERTAKAKFVRKKGTDTYEKSQSDEYTYSIDNINFNATEFRDWLTANIAPDDMMRFLLGGEFFVNQIVGDKKKARQIIERVVGEVTPEEMKGDYSAIAEDLKKYTLDEIDNKSSNLAKGISQRLNEIPSLIENAEHEIAEIEQVNFKQTEEEINRLESAQNDCDKRLLDISERMRPQLEEKAKAEHDKRMKQEVYDKAKKTYMQGLIDQDNNLCAEISRIEKENAEKKAHIAELQMANDIDKRAKDGHEKKLDEIRFMIESIKSKKYDGMSVCPVCGHELSQEMQEKSMNDFYEMNKRELKEVVGFGKEFKDYIDRINKEIENRQEEIDHIAFEDPEPLKQKLNALRTNDNVMPFEQTEQGKALQADIDAVVIPTVTIPENNEINAEKERIKAELVPLYERRGLKSRLQRLKENIVALQTEQREKGAELAKYETQRELVKAYKQEQMEILSRKVNDGLCFSRIEVWSKQKDGQMVPDLVLKDEQGVSFACTNNASRIVTTVDVQRFFCDRLGVNMPCWVDECAVVDDENMPRFDGTQMFYMFRADTSLKIETK